MVGIAVDGIGKTVVTDVHDDEQILSMDGLMNASLCLAASETGAYGVQQVAVRNISLKCGILMLGAFHILSEGNEIIVYLRTQSGGGFHGENLQGSDGESVFKFTYIRHNLFSCIWLQFKAVCCITLWLQFAGCQ